MKKTLSIIASFLTTAAIADVVPDVEVLAFSTVGPDTYADGTKVYDGECYALVWSADGNFDGINAKGEAVDANDKVIYIAPFAKDGKCENVVFQIASGLYDGGVFDIYLLDTRVWGEGGVISWGKKDGKVAQVNKAVKAVGNVTVAKANAAPTAGDTAVAGVSATDATALPDVTGAPKVTAIDLDGDQVVLTVEGTSAYASYAVKSGDKVGALNAEGTAKQGGGTVKFVSPKQGNSGFFTVNRK